ncbi:MAG: insulinase family protein [Clostridia bacterium]|nr:insulinase family protein [Clostridia bacterium]
MVKAKQYENGLKLIVNTAEGFSSVSAGIIVNTGSRNETESENGLSHFIEHTVFKGTKKRSAFDISDEIDGIGAQINAFTSKELTCYYTKSTADHVKECVEILSDVFFDAEFKKEELEKEKNVIIEEINMNEDSPEDVLLDLLSESRFGKRGLGQTILGPVKNVRRFTAKDVFSYMDKFYTADNVVLSFSGNITFEIAEKLAREYFAERFTRIKGAAADEFTGGLKSDLIRVKKTEQTHIGFSLPAFSVFDERSDALSVVNNVFGGGMSSRLFQRIREKAGLCYSVYSYPSQYRDCGVIEIYSGVKTESRDLAASAIIEEIEKFRKNGMTEREFVRGKEQVKSAFVFGKESTASLMLLYGKYYLFFDQIFDFDEKIKRIESITINDANDLIRGLFDTDKISTATLGPNGKKLTV